jgi:hypothetical protein
MPPSYSMSRKYLVWYWIGEFVIAKFHPQASGQKWHIHLSTNQYYKSIENNSREIFGVIKSSNELISYRWTNIKIDAQEIWKGRELWLLQMSMITQQSIWLTMKEMKSKFLISKEW